MDKATLLKVLSILPILSKKSASYQTNKQTMPHEIIQNRRSVYPKTFNDKPVERAQIERLLQAANLAPNHKRTEPWRFKVFMGDAPKAFLAKQWGDFYFKKNPNGTTDDAKYLKGQSNCLRSSCIIAIVVHYSEKLPAIEETCAVACAVQNLLLQASHEGLGAFWSTGGPTASDETTRQFLNLPANESCLGFLFIGNHDLPLVPSAAGDYAEKVEWVD
jgi:nitroreductase